MANSPASTDPPGGTKPAARKSAVKKAAKKKKAAGKKAASRPRKAAVRKTASRPAAGAGTNGAGAKRAGRGAARSAELAAAAEERATARDAATLAKIDRSTGKNLVIVESPAKAKTLEKFLGRDFFVLASYGHVRDLPKSGLGIDVDRDFEPQYVAIEGKTKVLSHLKKAAGVAREVYLAPDPDREGEAIAWHLAAALGEGTARAVRVFSGSEQIRLDTDVRGYLLHLENLGILSAQQREVVIDRLLALEADDIDIEQLKWVVLMVLFSQPGQENAYQRMEDLVFDERRDAMH